MGGQIAAASRQHALVDNAPSPEDKTPADGPND